MNTIKVIATYCRVSTSAQEEQQTIKNQINSVLEYAQKNGYTIVKEYIDDGWSGDMLARPSLDELRQDAKKKIWQGVLIYDPDRLARRYSYQELVMDELREAGIEVIFVTIAAPKNSEDKILHGVRGLFAEYERAKISERFRLGKLRKVREGHLLVSEPLYGYRYFPMQNNIHGYYEINPDEARVVEMIFSWLANDGLTLRKVVRKLQMLGIKPRKSKRGVWSTSTLSTLLRNKAYIGEAHWGSSYAVVPENPTSKEKYRKNKKSSRRIRPEEEWFTIPVPAIIDKELFKLARERLEENFKLCQRNTKNQYLLAKKIYCQCGNKRSGEGPQHGKHLYYRCNDRALSFPLPHNCKERGLNARIADALVWDKVKELMSSPELLFEQIERIINTEQNDSAGNNFEVQTDALSNEILKLKREEDRYNIAYGEGLLAIEKLREYIGPLRDKLQSFETQLHSLNAQGKTKTTSLFPNRNEIQAFANKAAKTGQTDQGKPI